MKLSDKLYRCVEPIWKEAADKPFVTEMAKGNLRKDRFHYYMIQDYMYLKDYINLLGDTLHYTDDPSLKDFLITVIEETKLEAKRVHEKYLDPSPSSDDGNESDINKEPIPGKRPVPCMEPVLIEYVAYMQDQLSEKGLLAGLTALLQCSWVYAYIGQTLTERYPDQIRLSPYKDWFEAYTCQEYIDANQAWIDALDNQTTDITSEEAEHLCEIFIHCAKYENAFWDRLYQM